jgi:hypothetical protein
MPVSFRTCPDAGQICEPFSSPYRKETSSAKFSAFLNRPLTLHSRNMGESARFSVVELLRHLKIEHGLLKGSTVNNWKNNQTGADIDLQFLSESADKKQITESLIEFLNSRSNRRAETTQSVLDKTWLSKVAHQLKDSWHRTIISVGYSQNRGTTLDLNFTNSRTVTHDVIHASKAIHFNWAQPKTFIIDSWHPALVEWLSKHDLLWFKPDIDSGLVRLSYRLSKSPNAHLLQPDLALHFCEQASHASLQSVCMRIMMNEYSRGNLQPDDRQRLWEPVIAAAAKPDNKALERDLLAWSKFNTLDQLKESLSDPNQQTAVINRLTQGCQIGADFKQAVKNVLKNDPDIQTRLKCLIRPALGATLVPGALLFKKLDTWNCLHEVPEHELRTVFSDCLQKLAESADAICRTRAQNMLGWLDGDDVASLKFWLDRIPASLRSNPPEQLTEPVLDAALHLIQTRGVESLTPAMPQLSQIRIRLEDWHTLARTLMNAAPTSSSAESASADFLALQFMRVLVRNSPLMSAFIPGAKVDLEGVDTPMPTHQFHTQLMAFTDNILPHQIPPMLRSVLCMNRNDIEIKLPDLLLQVSKTQRTAVAVLGPIKHWVNENSYAVLQPTPAGTGHSLQVMWRDGAVFSGQQTGNGNFNFDGVLSQIIKPGTKTGLTGLLEAGRLLASNLFSDLNLQHSHWACTGLFNGQQLLKADQLDQALLAMKQGCVREQASGSGFWIEHHISDHKPVSCKVIAQNVRSSVELKMAYQPPRKNSNITSLFKNPWKVEPELSGIQSICQLNAPPFGGLQFTTHLPWNDEEQVLRGMGEVTVKGAIPFKWFGRIEAGKLLPEGRLILDKQKEPAIEFNISTPSASIPMTLLPVMADLLGKHSNERYPYTPRVWGEHNTWPEQGFEGFVNLLPCGDKLFSGYVTSTGLAQGVLSEIACPDSYYHTAWTGSFLVQALNSLNARGLALDHQRDQPFRIPLPDQRVLLPHGVVHQHTVKRVKDSDTTRQEQLYFCGEEIPYRQISQQSKAPYNSPNLPRYFVGLNYTQNQQAKHLDLVFNPGDGGHDFIIIRPKHYDKQANYQEIYRDSQGVSASWLVIKGRHQIGKIRLPAGIEYSGQISLQNNQFLLEGNGKFDLGAMSFSGEFVAGTTVKNLKGLNPESTHWVNTYCATAADRTFQLNEWLEIISGGELNWEADVKAHLRCRELETLRKDATVFSKT